MRDVLGYAVAALIGLVTLALQPWSPQWWAGIIVATAIAAVATAHLFVQWWNKNKDRRTAVPAPIILMVVSALTFCGAVAWYFWPAKDSAEAIAKLAELGWTVKPGPGEILFEAEFHPFPHRQGNGCQR